MASPADEAHLPAVQQRSPSRERSTRSSTKSGGRPPEKSSTTKRIPPPEPVPVSFTGIRKGHTNLSIKSVLYVRSPSRMIMPKKLCAECIMQTLRQENIMTPSDVRAIIREEMQGLAQTSSASTRQPSRSRSPVSSESEGVCISSDEEGSQPSSSETEGGLCLPNSNVDNLIKSVRSTMGCPDGKEKKSAQDIMFAGLGQRKRRSFPVIQTIKDIVKKEWDKQNRGFLPSSSKRRYPFSDEDLNTWSKVPKVDAAVASTTKQSVLPVEDSGVLTDPLDRKAEALLKRSWEVNTGAFRPAISSTCTARSLLVWTEQLEEQIRGKTSRESILLKLPQIKEAVAFLADASVDSLRLAARSAGLVNTARRALWLKNWKGDAQAKAKLCAIPCQGEFLFGKTLDELLNKAGEPSGDAPLLGTSRLNKESDGSRRTQSKKELGWIVNFEKSRLNPEIVQTFLGIQLDSIHGTNVRIYSDNSTAVAYLNRQGGTKSGSLMTIAANIFQLAEAHLTSLTALHIKGVENIRADYLSRNELRQGEWTLNKSIFRRITEAWGIPQIDLFATRDNRQVQRFASLNTRDHPDMLDSLHHPWRFRLAYAFPPMSLIPLGHKKGHGVTRATISRWIRDAICLAYTSKGEIPPVGIKAHSTRAMASSWAEQADVPIHLICKAATWSTPSTFYNHYRLDLSTSSDLTFDRAVLNTQTLLQGRYESGLQHQMLVRVVPSTHGNQGKHRVTKRGPALSYPMFTLVTSEDIAGSAMFDKATSHTKVMLQKAGDHRRALEKEINVLQWEIEFDQVRLKNLEESWKEKYERIQCENAALKESLELQTNEVKVLRSENTIVNQQCQELLAMLDVKQQKMFQDNMSFDKSSLVEVTALELAVLGACTCCPAGEPCSCAKMSAATRKHLLQLRQEFELEKKSKEEAYVMADAFRIAFEQQLKRKNDATLPLSEIERLCKKGSKRLNSWRLLKEDGDSISRARNKSLGQKLKDLLVSSADSMNLDAADDPQEVLRVLIDLLNDKEEALAHQRKVSYMLARTIEGKIDPARAHGKSNKEPSVSSDQHPCSDIGITVAGCHCLTDHASHERGSQEQATLRTLETSFSLLLNDVCPQQEHTVETAINQETIPEVSGHPQT
ncbi:unnamed protein product [Ranitomeya imitator]|uniref:Lamina-associated polypeptide 2 alpha C-terminal domain-containing protein n=1 Tax=Ranitomeya imitator TaxID=111125 RepID=A0ABN9LLX6_9NEOB|nr:unnamed protein product [Ranitomeya imitator]